MHPTLLHSNDKDDVHREDKQSQMAETLLLVDTNKGRRAAKEGGNGLIGHLLSRPTLTYHNPFAPVIRRPTNNTSMETDPSPLLSPIPYFHPFLLFSSLPDACTQRVREREERSMRKAHSFPFRVSLARSTSFEARDERVVEFSNRFSRIVSRCNRVLSSRGYIIGKLFQRSVFLSFIRSFRYFSSRTKRNCGTRSAGESLIDGRNIVGIASIGGCWWRLDTGNKFSLVQLIKFRREIN